MSIYYTGRGDDGESRVGRKKYPKTMPEFAALGDLDELNSLLGIVKNMFGRCSASNFSQILTHKYRRRDWPRPHPDLRKVLAEHFSANSLGITDILEQIQQDLFIIQAHVGAFWFEKKYKPPNFSHNKIRILEKYVARFEKKLSPLNKFIVPGANELSAWLDYARAVSRRAERSVVMHHAKHPLNPAILSYCNRLSSLLFVLARTVSAKSGNQEQLPNYGK